MNFGAALKTRQGRIVLASVVLANALLCGIGLMRGTELPAISLAAESIPLPFTLPLFGNQIPNTLPATWLTMLILIGIGVAYSRAQREEGPPSCFQVAVETVVEGMLGFMENAVGEKARIFFPLLATFFLFITISNWCGILPGFGSVGVRVAHHAEEAAVAEGAEHEEHMELVPFFRSANAHLSTTLALAIISVAASQYYGFKVQGKHYLDKYLNFRVSS
jgi:F-type H+-transporting ATPase subunit a